MIEYCYYIIPNTFTSEKNSLSNGDRIVAIPTSWPINLHPIKSEGPFISLHYLIELSKVYNSLKTKNSRRAHKIIQEKYIIKAEDYILTPKGEKFQFDLIDSIDHSIKGNFKKDILSGVHFYDNKSIKIIEEIELNDKGVWTALIEKIDENGKWVKKKRPTTFFPKNWSVAKTISEIMFAEKIKIQKAGEVNVYESSTRCGIKIEFILEKGIRKTVYPII